ncbi:hypothetical protein FP2506_10626 [Fulvimarina pelagi HTCC2506]|uniref:SHOCT domain-containing protein n=1 Tax=Fulvimarina pelagi HTCC2506 TaxID=314231 RepID=Q0G4X1_9HYPH|nr:SHOCT domain-containing protein [Fulvimarina pelagi]EAU43293.1 hypothetical protein FP2506_10626 [Fulvimarina pelagi HTCC2506]
MDDTREIARISSSTGFSEDAVRAMAEALRAGNGTMAQFNHFELGGFGQWSAGGMLMIGDMFNNALKGRVGALADIVSASLARGDLPMRTARGFGATNHWWPEELGQPSSSGAQNGIRYAVFPGTARLAVETGGRVTIYDTGEHRIGGVSQQQSGTSTLRFSSQLGSVEPGDLEIVDCGPVEDANNTEGATAEHPYQSTTRESGRQSQTSSAQAAAVGSFQSQSQGSSFPPFRAPVEETAARGAPRTTQFDPEPAIGAEKPAASDVSPAARGLDSITPEPPVSASVQASTPSTPTSAEKPTGDPLALLRGLAELKNEGILTEEEFAAKKAELLSRL